MAIIPTISDVAIETDTCNAALADAHGSMYEKERQSRRSDEEPRPLRNPSVRFSTQIVSQVRERPRTTEEERPIMYYSASDMQRFRHEYRTIVCQRRAAKLQAQQRAQPAAQALTPLSALARSAAKFLSVVQQGDLSGVSGAASAASSRGSITVDETCVLVDTMYLF